MHVWTTTDFGMEEKDKEENYIFLFIKLYFYITIGWRGAIIGASKNRLGAFYVRERDRAPLLRSSHQGLMNGDKKIVDTSLKIGS